MSKPPFERGRLVLSKQGRDAKRPFIILEVVDADYVLMADGDLRKLSRPKRKKVKHLIPKPDLMALTEQTIDSDIRKAINAFMNENDQLLSKEGCALVKG